MRILVTGKNGQLGQSLQKIVGAMGDSSQSANDYIFIGRDELDLRSQDGIDNYFSRKFDIIINCAAYTSVEKAEKDWDQVNQVNHLAVKQLARIANKQKAKLIHISTDYVFDGKGGKPYTEIDVTNPINIYGETKLSGEKSIQKVMPTNAIIIRTSWVYSEFGRNFVKTILRLGKERDEIRVVIDQIGSPTYATDLAEAILLIINSKDYQSKDQNTEIYNYSNKGEISWYDFARQILKDNKNCTVIPITAKKRSDKINRPKYTVLNTDKILKEFGISERNWKESLEIMRGFDEM
jgi:dTDP-4-dehydrorhamnose reductase